MSHTDDGGTQRTPPLCFRSGCKLPPPFMLTCATLMPPDITFFRPYVIRQLRGFDDETGAPNKLSRLSKAHAADSALYLIQHCLGYFLMLIAMVYNVGLFVAVIVGAAIGYFCFAEPSNGKTPSKDDDCCD